MASNKIPVYSVNDLKNTTDDALVAYFTNGLPKPQRFAADNTKSNIRLLLGYSAVTIAAIAFGVDYYKGWEATRPWITEAVIAYFVINCALSIWIWAVERHEIFKGSRGKGETVEISSSAKKNSPLYTLEIRHTSGSGKVIQQDSITASFSQWFSADGTFHLQPLKSWLASEMKLVAEAEGAEKQK